MTSGSLGGRPKGIVRVTRVRTGAYSTPEQLPNILKFWRKHKPCNFYRVQDIIQRYLRQLGWDTKHPRRNEILDIAVMTVSRGELFMDIIQKDFTRNVTDPSSGHFVKARPADQIRLMEKLDIDIQTRLVKLGFFKSTEMNKQETGDEKTYESKDRRNEEE